MSIIKTNQIQRVDGQPVLNTTGSVIQTVVSQSDTKTSLNVTSKTEPSTNYRVSITPTHADNRIYLTYMMLVNVNMAQNTLFQLRAEKFTSGSAASRQPVDFIARPGNGYDANDQNTIMWECFDVPNSTATQTYGFTYSRETGGSGTIYFGYSYTNNSSWGFHHPVTIIAREVVQ